ncbi:hypothetical protein DSM104299_01894 [Baekduia alba]|uniref:hypothetical protein n=1 Tax=Baekduia alba TaxID=2997333 RepID=UPI002341FB66|nr:hypothetical protein [Baekduia alba]WCB93188.1 hypothetical protein DSM104299_01894 [Baekduia alba]
MDSPLDRVLPQFAHSEVHAVDVSASPERVWAALHEVTVAEMPVTRVLTLLRGLGSRGAQRPILQAFTARGFTVVIDEEPRALAVVAAGQPWHPRGGATVAVADVEAVTAFAQPGYVLMALSFGLESLGGHAAGRTRLTTETRVHPTDPAAARKFRRYWWAIRAGSGLIRHDLLRAVRRRAEQAATTT